MRYWILSAALWLPGVLAAGAAQEHDKHEQEHKKHKEHKGQSRPMHHHQWSVDEWLERLESPERAVWQKPNEVVDALGLKAGDKVADIGAGSGYFSTRFARAVGGTGKVFAVDIDHGLVRHLRDRASNEKLRNMEAVPATPDDPKLTAGSVDVVFICNVLHHVENRPAYYEKLAAALRPGGRLAVVDFYKRELPVGPGVEMKIAREEMVRELSDAGFRLGPEFEFLPHQYFLVFEAAGR